jgi:hypothetical protein
MSIAFHLTPLLWPEMHGVPAKLRPLLWARMPQWGTCHAARVAQYGGFPMRPAAAWRALTRLTLRVAPHKGHHHALLVATLALVDGQALHPLQTCVPRDALQQSHLHNVCVYVCPCACAWTFNPGSRGARFLYKDRGGCLQGPTVPSTTANPAPSPFVRSRRPNKPAAYRPSTALSTENPPARPSPSAPPPPHTHTRTHPTPYTCTPATCRAI